jgi:DinB superfamily
MTRFADIPDLVLSPLAGRPDDDWYRAPVGKWNPAQIVDHLGLGLEWTAAGFEARRARDPMVRRPLKLSQRLARVLLMDLGVFPPGFNAPRDAIPAPHASRAAAEAQLRQGFDHMREVAKLLLPTRAGDLFVKHPFVGDLTLPEWMKFHVVHAKHHTRQIRRRLRA